MGGLGAVLICGALLPVGGQDTPDAQIARDDEETCLSCHGSDMGEVRAVRRADIDQSPHAEFKCQDCHSSITSAPHTEAMLKEKAACGTCHPEPLSAYAESVHGRSDKKVGDHPTCVSCHSSDNNPHAILRGKRDPRHVVALCARCHSDASMMGRYGVDPDAAHSYGQSFHGKALMRFGMTNAATCVSCHGNHDVRAPSDPKAPTHRTNAAATCGQAGCHPGAKMNFAMSGANHLALKVKKSLILRLEELGFQWLTIGTMLFLLGGIALDLRVRAFTRRSIPWPTRAISFLVSLSYLALVSALAMGLLGFGRPRWTGVAAIILLVLAIVIWALAPKPAKQPRQKEYRRLDLPQRLQHILLFTSFIVLALTGLPLRFPHNDWLHALYMAIGGMPVARLTHRIAAVVMIVAWIWHTLDLIVRWKRAGFTLSSITMLPTKKDVHDFIGLSKYYLGIAREQPRFDRFDFRQKFDYFAVYWGMPIMVFSGFVLWFPIYFGNVLPEIGLSAAYIAHSDEAILAFLAIAVWHFYNVHFSPGDFPMSPTWWTGRKSRSQMEHEHPLELERIDRADAG